VRERKEVVIKFSRNEFLNTEKEILTPSAAGQTNRFLHGNRDL
jgi:hypothetical protein